MGILFSPFPLSCTYTAIYRTFPSLLPFSLPSFFPFPLCRVSISEIYEWNRRRRRRLLPFPPFPISFLLRCFSVFLPRRHYAISRTNRSSFSLLLLPGGCLNGPPTHSFSFSCHWVRIRLLQKLPLCNGSLLLTYNHKSIKNPAPEFAHFP